MDTTVSRQEEKNKKRGFWISIMIHIGLIILALLPLLTYPDPPPGQEGILVNLGLPDVGQGNENAAPASSQEAPEVTEVEEEVEPEPETSEPVEREPVTEPEPTPQRETVTTEDPSEVALREKRKKEQAEARERERREKQEREARERAEAEKRAKEAEANKLKDLLSGGLSGSGKEGKGNTGKPGNQGDPGGDPNSDILEGISTGSGRVGGGLGSRGVLSSPSVSDNSQDQGTVVIYVCVNSNGSVTEARVTQKGTTATSQRLISKAVANAERWRFSKGSVDKQCGTITYNFKVR